MIRRTLGCWGASRRARTAVLILGLLSVSSFAAESEVLGGHEGWLDRMGAGVRELGQGNTGTDRVDGALAAFWNPALLPFPKKPQLALGGEIRSLDRNGGYVSFQERLTGNLGVGITIVNRGDLKIPILDGNEDTISGLLTAAPQAFASYLSVGLRTSRGNAFGATVQWYTSNMEVANYGDITFVGGFNLGWYRRLGDSLSVSVVVRNLGINERLSAEFDQNAFGGDDASAYGSALSAPDFFPKTLVVAGEWRKSLLNRAWTFSAEVMDYQLKNVLFTPNPAFHSQAARVGAECEVAEAVQLRAGLDRLNPTIGFGYTFKWNRRPIQFDYALTMERGFLTFNPYAIGLKTVF